MEANLVRVMSLKCHLRDELTCLSSRTLHPLNLRSPPSKRRSVDTMSWRMSIRSGRWLQLLRELFTWERRRAMLQSALSDPYPCQTPTDSRFFYFHPAMQTSFSSAKGSGTSFALLGFLSRACLPLQHNTATSQL